jgi:hypothetical protein
LKIRREKAIRKVQRVIALSTIDNLELNVFSLLKPQPIAFDSSASRFDNAWIYKQEFPGEFY